VYLEVKPNVYPYCFADCNTEKKKKKQKKTKENKKPKSWGGVGGRCFGLGVGVTFSRTDFISVV